MLALIAPRMHLEGALDRSDRRVNRVQETVARDSEGIARYAENISLWPMGRLVGVVKPKYLDRFPKPLLDDLVAGRWLPVIGSGFSQNAVLPPKKRMPLWNDLGKAIAGEMTDYDFTTPIEAISAYEYEFGRPKLIEKLSNLLHVGVVRPGEAHEAFCQVPFDIVCTTNFDFLLERQYENTPRSCTPVIDEEQLSINVRESSVALFKLHGDLNHPGQLVATEDDYDAFLRQYPIKATYLANLLITRTAVLIGFSLEDPDFRQVWQTVGDRLGKSRRLAYVLTVGASPAEASRFERRGVKLINLGAKNASYSNTLSGAFVELRDYWRENVVAASYVTEEGPLYELSLPEDSATRLCFFAIPLSLNSLYRERVFPMVKDIGLVPVTADDVISPGDSWMAKIDALMMRSSLSVVDASSEFTLAEAKMAMGREQPNQVFVVVEEGRTVPFDVPAFQVVRRPKLTTGDLQPFLDNLRGRLERAASSLEQELSNEPKRLLQLREYRAAIISAITLLETSIRERIDIPQHDKKRPVSLREVLGIAREQGILGKFEAKQIIEWLTIRNEVVHGRTTVHQAKAKEIVNGVEEIVGNIE